MRETSTRLSSLNRYALPGFGLPLNFTAKGAKSSFVDEGNPLYPSALDAPNSASLTTLREFTMMRFMNQLTDKPEWDTKVFDEAIVDKWKTEALAASEIDMTETMFKYCIDELRYKSKSFRETGSITVYNGDVVKSDNAIPLSLRDALRAAAKPLEDVPEALRDWHPGSNETVLDLVHPSLFPLVYGRTRILKDSTIGLDDCIQRCGEGEVLPVPPADEAQLGDTRYNDWMQDPFSRKFQWLPCEVEFEDDNLKITSYINNLHPQAYQPLYRIIEQIIQLTIPLWNQTLTPLESYGPWNLRVLYTDCEYDPDPESFPEDKQPQQRPGESDDEFWERRDLWVRTVRRVVRPEPPPFKAPNKESTKETDLRRDFGQRGLQVIVKLANIHLTAEKPEYAGGTWHVEGQMNEHICATALYYYDSSNITESLLSFRQQSAIDDVDVSYDQDHHDWLPAVFGCEQDSPALQYIGDVVAKEGRLLTFPNILQHRVSPFELVDKTKPGHRKILALFLVDPHIGIISTANVPCQQKAWWAEKLRDGDGFRALPGEMMKEILDKVEEFPIGMDEAKELRIKLMEERKSFVQRHDEHMRLETFSLCEH